ncbi:MAG: hypothetical protein N3B13_08155 [Deltaproteobacteria bacterium]|nr:hypothetical protein [Deltaproteobacteria bacterium]
MKETKNVNIIDSILHDIKSPLSNITGYTKLLLSNVVGEINQEQRDYLSRIRRNSYRINLYVDDVADAARILYFQKEISLSRFGLREIIKASAERNEPVLNDFRSGFFLIETEEDIQIMSDPERLGRTIDVLVSNLTKDINKRKILLAFGKAGEYAQIIISHAAEITSNIEVFLQRFEKSEEAHLIQHAATSTIIVPAIGGKIEMCTSNISERMFILSFPILNK